MFTPAPPRDGRGPPPRMRARRRRPVWTTALFFLGLLDASRGFFSPPAATSPSARLVEEAKSSQRASVVGEENIGSDGAGRCGSRPHRGMILKGTSGDEADAESGDGGDDDAAAKDTVASDPQPAGSADASKADDDAREVTELKIPRSPEEFALAVENAREKWAELDATTKSSSAALLALTTAVVGGLVLGDGALGPLSGPVIRLSLPCVFLLGAPELSLLAGAKITAETKRIIYRLASADDVGLFASTSSGSETMLLGEATIGVDKSNNNTVSDEGVSPDNLEAEKMRQELTDLSMKIDAVEDLINEANATTKGNKLKQGPAGSSTIIDVFEAEEADKEPSRVTSEKNPDRTERVMTPATPVIEDADVSSLSKSAPNTSKKEVTAPREAEKVDRISTPQLQTSIAKPKTSTRMEAGSNSPSKSVSKDADVSSLSESAPNALKKEVTAPMQAEKVDRISTPQLQTAIAKPNTSTIKEAGSNSPSKSVSERDAAKNIAPVQAKDVDPSVDNDIIPTPQSQASLAQPQNTTKMEAEANPPPNSPSIIAQKASTMKKRPEKDNGKIAAGPPQTSLAQPKAATETEEASLPPKPKSNVPKKAVTASGQVRKAEPAMGSTRISTPSVQTSVAQSKTAMKTEETEKFPPKAVSNTAKQAVTAPSQASKVATDNRIPTPPLRTSTAPTNTQTSVAQSKTTMKTEEKVNFPPKAVSNAAKKAVTAPSQASKVATDNRIPNPPLRTSTAPTNTIPSFLKPTGISAPAPKVKGDMVLTRREKIVFDYKVASAAFAAVALSTVGLSGGYVAPALLSASGPALAAGVAWILSGAANRDRLDSDACKRLNLSLAAFSLCSLLAGVLSLSSYSARDRALSGAFLASLLALSPSAKGWAYGVGGIDSSKPVKVLPEICKGAFRSVKGLMSVRNFTSLGYFITTVFASVTKILTVFEIARLLQAEADCRAVVLRLARLARFTLLTAISHTLKDAANRGHLGESTFIRLNVLSAVAFGSVAASAYKSVGGLLGPAARAFFCSAFCLYNAIASVLGKRKRKMS